MPTTIRILGVLLLALVALDLPTAVAADRTLRFGHIWPPEGGWGSAAQRFADVVSQRSGGKIEVKVFPSSQLGNERELEEVCQEPPCFPSPRQKEAESGHGPVRPLGTYSADETSRVTRNTFSASLRPSCQTSKVQLPGSTSQSWSKL